MLYLLIFALQHFIDICQDVGNRNKSEFFDQYAPQKHFISKQNISNVRVKIKDNATIRHKNDALSVSIFVAELRNIIQYYCSTTRRRKCRIS